MRRKLALLLTLLLAMQFAAPGFGEIIHREKSLYRNIIVVKANNRICLLFTANRIDRNQSCVNTKQPDKLVFTYVRMVFGALLANPDPRKILVVGLGGGSIPLTLQKLYPDATIDVSEIDDAVSRVARDYFNFTENQNMKVIVSDARVFVKRALLTGKKYDLIILDAFTGDYIPEHLMTREFLNETNELLTPDGVLVANTFSTSRLYDHESATYQAVFGKFFNFRMEGTSNRVIITVKRTGDALPELPDTALLAERARDLSARLEPFGIEILKYPELMDTHVDWNTSAKPLSDNFSPANLLNN
jgi:spermidine synthase